jgi:hypothetical protein
MARIETDPNYTSPTFSRATAATDIFKKEDVQALAAAMSTHDHSAGKGLVLSAGSIPAGSITSTMVADGTLTAADLAFGATIGLGLGPSGLSNGSTPYGGSGSSTTSTVYVDIPSSSVTFNVAFATSYCLLHASMGATGPAGTCDLSYCIDGNSVYQQRIGGPTAGYIASFSMTLVAQLSAGNHTFKLQWRTNVAGTLSMDSVTGFEMYVLELKR